MALDVLVPQLVQVRDSVYCATGYARSNISYVITASSVVVIDTTESPAAARASLRDFRKICDLPIRFIIYTHYHGDHIRGASVFHSPETTVVANRRLPRELEKVNRVLPYFRRITALQFATGYVDAPTGRGMFIHAMNENGYVQPDVLFDDRHEFTEGGVRFELIHAPGETPDQTIVWLPEARILFPGDLFYRSFPMLSSPMKPDRPVLDWATSVERLAELGATVLAPAHCRPIEGAGQVRSLLRAYAAAIRHVHDETVRHINEGRSVDQARALVRLPPDLARHPSLQEAYGKVAWAVNGIYRQYTGWYDLDPATLNRTPRAELGLAVLQASRGARPLLLRAAQALRAGRAQLALELSDLILAAKPRDRATARLRLAALRALASRATNGVERNIYLMAERDQRRRLARPVPARAVLKARRRRAPVRAVHS